MNRAELVEAITKQTGVSKKDTEAVIKAFVETTQKTVAKADGKVTLIGFGTFEVSKRKARTGRNPQTGEKIKISAKKVPVFKAGKEFKDIVNGVKKTAPAKASAKKTK